jgi:hypothetical protein
MKYIFLILWLAAGLGTQAQPATTDYDTCQYLNRYAGEWLYANGQDTIRICLRPHRSFLPDYNIVMDQLWGWHEYKRGNIIIESNYQYRNIYLPYTWINDSISGSKYSVLLSLSECDPVRNALRGIIADYSQASELKVVTAVVTGSTMTWKQRHGEGYGTFTGAYGMTLPTAFVLIKQ